MQVGEYYNLNIDIRRPTERCKDNHHKTPLPPGYPPGHFFYFIKEILDDGTILVAAGLSHRGIRVNKPGMLWKVTIRNLVCIDHSYINQFQRKVEQANLALFELKNGRVV